MINELQRQEIFDSLVHEREIPLKFAYLDAGANHWNEMMDVSVNLPVGAKNLERDTLTAAVEFLAASTEGRSGLHVIDLGCGDGSSALNFIQAVQKQVGAISYTAVDLSEALVATAIAKIQAAGDFRTAHLVYDFEKSDPALLHELRNHEKKNVFLMLGNTLANLPEQKLTLTTMLSALAEEDVFLLGLELYSAQHAQDLIKYYGNEKASTFVYYIPGLFGITPDNTKLRVVWDEQALQVILLLEVTKPITVAHPSAPSYTIHRGEHITVARSKKYTTEGLQELLVGVAANSHKVQVGNYVIMVLSKTHG